MTVCCVMAKAPIAGAVKTRLVPALGAEDAARVAAGFLLDTWSAAVAAFGEGALLSFAGPRDRFPPELEAVPSAPQSGEDLGVRIESAIWAGLGRGSRERVIVIGSDLPGLSEAMLRDAAALLEDADVCLGPSSDGGYYLIGARRWESGLLAGLPWSAANTREATRARLAGRGYAVAMAAPFEDIDEPDELDALRARLAVNPELAPHTAAALGRIEPW